MSAKAILYAIDPATGMAVPVLCDADGHLQIEITGATIETTVEVAETVTLAAGSAAIGKLAANAGVDIGNVGIKAGTAVIGHVIVDPTSVVGVYGFAKGDTVSAQPTVTPVDADHNGLDVVVLDAPAIRALVNTDVVTAELSATDNAVLDAIVAALAPLAREPHNLAPNGTQADQALTVDATGGGVQFSAFHADTTHVFWSCADAQVRVTFDNSAPTSSNGHFIEAGDSGVWSKALAVAAKFIRTGGTSGIVSASQLKGA